MGYRRTEQRRGHQRRGGRRRGRETREGRSAAGEQREDRKRNTYLDSMARTTVFWRRRARFGGTVAGQARLVSDKVQPATQDGQNLGELDSAAGRPNPSVSHEWTKWLGESGADLLIFHLGARLAYSHRAPPTTALDRCGPPRIKARLERCLGGNHHGRGSTRT